MCARFSAAIVLVAVALLGSPVRGGSHDTVNPGVWDPGTMPFGQTYGQWSGDWWQWGLGSGLGENPLLDETGEFGHVGQSEGPVWFLAGTFGGAVERTVVVPEGRSMFIPLVNSVFIATEVGETCEVALASVNADIDGITDFAGSVLEASVDGVELQQLLLYRADTPDCFNLTVTEGSLGNALGLDPGVYLAASDGYWVMLDPLEFNEPHVIHFRALNNDPAGAFEVDVTYNIVPEPSSVVLLMMGVIGLVAGSRRRSRRRE